jgi:hypothetical protein
VCAYRVQYLAFSRLPDFLLRFDVQLTKANKALLEFAEQVAEDDPLSTRLPDKVQKPHGKASGRSYTGAETAELATDQAEQRSRVAAGQTATPDTPESDIEDVIVPSTPPLPGESQRSTTTALAIRTPDRLREPPELTPAQASEPGGAPEAQVEPPALTAPVRIEQGPRKRRRVANKPYRDSQYELR